MRPTRGRNGSTSSAEPPRRSTDVGRRLKSNDRGWLAMSLDSMPWLVSFITWGLAGCKPAPFAKRSMNRIGNPLKRKFCVGCAGVEKYCLG